ncbi:MAG UNVERIFIED_CONTAM: GrpB family protein [Rickettsiaceae bacterium]|jgi:GrpB-like predicted nucleotidyltransferase (UPF0157 family)
MCAKEDIDILCIIDDLQNTSALKEIGYIFKGEFNIPLRHFFSKNTIYSKVNLHITEQNHGFIKLQLAFRDYLRSNPGTAKEYFRFKRRIDSKTHFTQK